jgi:acyl carrier protein phosphodiesterase
MNHVAHCLLSFGDEDLLLGNFIGDFVKGSDWRNYPPGVQQGILLHRQIDMFTDRHEMVDRSVKRLRPFAGRWTPPFVDILYDHLLLINWENQEQQSFEAFAQTSYQMLAKRADEMPAILQERLPRMIEGRFLHGYQQRQGMEWVLDRFSRRLPTVIDVPALSEHFFENLEQYLSDFQAFFPALEAHARNWLYPKSA